MQKEIDVFISYSTNDKTAADIVCHVLEENWIKCWIAPRDVLVGASYPSQIYKAIDNCKILVLIYSNFSNNSRHVCNEIDLAFNKEKLIIPFLIDETVMNDEFQYYLNRKHWLVAYPDYKEKIQKLVETIIKQIGNQRLSPIPQGPPCFPIRFVYVEGGEFEMGATIEQGKDAFETEKPYHVVRLSSFLISETPVTVSQYRNYCKASGKEMPPIPSWGWIDNHPIVNVSWYDALDFAIFYGYRLPNEAQWEYAARGGRMTKHYKYAGGNSPSLIGWFADNTYQKSTAPVKSKQPNELGIFDMSGNVYEWCSNWKYDYSEDEAINPEGPSDGIIKASRGGSWHSNSRSLRVSNRDDDPPEFFSHNVGFRVAKDI